MTVTAAVTATGILVGAFIAWNGFLIAIIRLLIARVVKDMDTRFAALSERMCSPSKCEELKRVAREIAETRVELPLAYFRREDAIRESTVNAAKFDALASAQAQFVLREDQIRETTVMHAKLDALAGQIQRLLERNAQA